MNFNQFLSFIAQEKDYNRQAKISDGRYNVLMQHYKQQMGDATSAFNRNYYRNYLDNSNARNMLKRVREQLGEQTKAMRNAAVVTGATPEAAVAAQKNNNRVLDSVVGTLANVDADAKSRAENAYEARKQQLADFHLGATMNHYDERQAIDFARKRYETNFIMSSVPKTMDKFVDILKSYYRANLNAPYQKSAVDAEGIPMDISGIKSLKINQE